MTPKGYSLIVVDWREQRDRAVAARGEALARQREQEVERARELIAGFVREALARGLPQTPLHALSYNGRTRFRTKLTGWYLNRKRTIAVDADGNYYVLLAPHRLGARLTGVTPQPEPPRLIVGEGARDGDSMPLRDLLTQRLLWTS